MAITTEQLRKLHDIRSGLEARRNSEKGDDWEKLARFVLPELRQKDEKNKAMFSSTAPECTSISSNALQGWAYGRTIGWMHISREDRSLKGKKESKAVEEWFRSCEAVMVDDLNRSSFYDEALAFTKVGFNLSTAIMLQDWDEKTGTFITENLNPRKCAIDQNALKEVDVLFYHFDMNKDEAMAAFGDKCPQKIQDSKDWTEQWEFTKAIFASTRFDMDIEGEGDWCEVIWCEDEKDQACSERRIKNVKHPFIVWRFARSLTGSAWGVAGPGELMLDAIVNLNVMEKATLKGAQLRLTPPVKATEGLEVNLIPEGITYVTGSEDYQYAIPPGNTQETLTLIQKKEQELREAYFVDFFLVLQQTMEQRKTATEAALLSDEKSQIMSSFTSRLNNDFLEKTLENLYELEMAHGRLPEAPKEIAGQDIKIDFISPLTIAQRKAQTYAPARQFLAETMAFAELDPSVKYIFKMPEYAQSMAQDLLIDMKFIRDSKEVERLAEQDRQLAMQQAQAQNQAQQAQTLNSLSKAPEQGSPAQQMLGVQGVQGSR